VNGVKYSNNRGLCLVEVLFKFGKTVIVRDSELVTNWLFAIKRMGLRKGSEASKRRSLNT